MTPISCILLSRGALSAGIAPDWGAALTQMGVQIGRRTVPLLRGAQAVPAGRPAALGSACFPMIPYAGRLRAGRFQFEGRTIAYSLNAAPEPHSSHGDGFTQPWELTGLRRASAIMERVAPPLAPIRYHCRKLVEVREDAVHVQLRVQNLETRRIPLGVGLHPYFAHRTGARLVAELPVQRLWDTQLMPTAREAHRERERFAQGIAATELPMAAEYEGWNGEMTVEWPHDGVRVRLVTQPRLSHAVIWAPAGADFFCFEPASHAVDSFNALPGEPVHRDTLVLEPGATHEQSFTFYVSRGVPGERYEAS